jgi:hypothetical protein
MMPNFTLKDALAVSQIIEVVEERGIVGLVEENADGVPVVVTGYVRCITREDGSKPDGTEDVRDLYVKIQIDPDDDDALRYDKISDLMAAYVGMGMGSMSDLSDVLEAATRAYVASQN